MKGRARRKTPAAVPAPAPVPLFGDPFRARLGRPAYIHWAGWHPPSKNVVFRGTMTRRIKVCRECRESVAAAKGKLRLRDATGPRRLTLEIGLRPRRRPCDVDAYWPALLDALKQAKLIIDDAPEWVVILPVRYYRDRRDWTRLTLEELP